MGPIPRCGARAAAESISRAGRIGVIICSRELTCFNLDDHDVIVTVRVTVNCPGAVSHSACQCHDDRLSEPGRRQSNNLNSNSPLVAVRPLEKKLELECRCALRHSSSEARTSGQQLNPTEPRRLDAARRPHGRLHSMSESGCRAAAQACCQCRARSLESEQFQA